MNKQLERWDTRYNEWFKSLLPQYEGTAIQGEFYDFLKAELSRKNQEIRELVQSALDGRDTRIKLFVDYLLTNIDTTKQVGDLTEAQATQLKDMIKIGSESIMEYKKGTP